MKTFSLLALLIMACTFQVSGQPAKEVPAGKINPQLLTDHWKASWITHPSESVLDYGVFHFRKSFTLKNIPERFIIHISADNRYRLFVNGTPVCFGPARGDLRHWFFESIDVAPYLRNGENILAAVVWNAGEYKPWAQISFRTGLIVQGNGPIEEIVNTDVSWKVIKDVAYNPAPAGSDETAGQFVVVGPCDRVDGSKYPWGWEKQGYDDKSWQKPKIIDIGHPYGVGTDVNWVLTPRNIPLMETRSLRFGRVRESENIVLPDGFPAGKSPLQIPSAIKVILLIDQEYLTTGYPEINLSGGKGSVVCMSYAESLYDNNGDKGNRNEVKGKHFTGYSDYFLPDGGNSRLFRPLWFRTWRYLRLEIKTEAEPLTINDLSSEFSAYPLEEKASFESDNPLLSRIWTAGWRTARLCANETYFDCPYYEQLQYIGDTRIQSMISLYVSGDDRLMRKALLQFDQSRVSEGYTHSRYPTSLSQFIPTFSLLWIDMVHDYWMMRDDPDFIKGLLKGIDQVLTWYGHYIDRNTGILGRVPYWNFVDWAKEWAWDNDKRIGGVPPGGQEGGSSITTMQLAYALQRAAELNEYFGQKEKAFHYNRMADSLTMAVYRSCYDEKKGYIADTPQKNEFSIHAQIFAVLTNTVPVTFQKDFTEKFMFDSTIIQPTMYFRAYLAQALKKTGLADKYVETLGLWEEMLDKGLTTFAENPDPARSDCHAWSSSPLYDMLATIAGIRPAERGFRSVAIEPAMGSLRYIRGACPHPAGMILFDLNITPKGGISGTITMPGDLKGFFKWKGNSVSLSGKTTINLDSEKNVSGVTVENLTFMGKRLTNIYDAKMRLQNTYNFIIR